MSQPPPLPKVAMIGCAMFIVGLVATVITYQWQWVLLTGAGFLTTCLWAAAERRDDE